MSKSNTALIAGVVACFVAVVTACTLVFIFAPDGADVGIFLSSILGFAGSTVAALVTLAQVQKVGRSVDYLANGGMDSKVRAGVADVLRPELVDPEVEQLLQHDRHNRATGSSTS